MRRDETDTEGLYITGKLGFWEADPRTGNMQWSGDVEDILGLPDLGRQSYWAIVRYEDIRRISRDPHTFRSGEGVQFADAPPEFLEASQSFLAMDAPRHTKLRGLVSAAFTPRQVARIEDGIRVNALAPGYFATELNDDFFKSEAGQALIKRVPQRRLGQLSELDGPLLFLAGDASSYVTGQTLMVDGGWTCR